MQIENPEKQVLFGIVEKDVLKGTVNPNGHPDGFPKPIKLGSLSAVGPKKKGKSLFKTRMEQKREKVKNGGQLPVPLPVQNQIVKDDQINKDNADRLAQMSRDEIEAERQELLARLDPRQSCIIGEHIFDAKLFLRRFFYANIFLRKKL